MTAIDYRGRDLVIIPNEEMLRLPTPELLQALFGTHLPADIHAAMGRDKRHAFLRTQPIHFQAVKQAFEAQHTPFSVAFEETPALPFATALQVEPRPYQNSRFFSDMGCSHFQGVNELESRPTVTILYFCIALDCILR